MLKQLRYFQSVVRLSSFSAAAEENFISQSAISQHLNRLRHAGVLECARSGNEVYYKVADERVADIIAALFDGEEADCL